jgi:tRNA(Ile)-lysidine synthase
MANMSLLERFLLHVKQENLFNSADNLLLAVSGGVDSVVLTHLCMQAGFNIVMAHCNFGLRGAESDRDENFVRQLAEKYHIKLLVKKFETKGFAEAEKLSIQEAARNLRYQWFLQLRNNGSVTEMLASNNVGSYKPQTYIATAHHANDSAETLLMNFFKGTGIKGLQGIRASHDPLKFIVRPLLFATKQELLAYEQQQNLSYVQDSSNDSDKYTRNYFRNKLLPDIKKVFPEVEQNLVDNLQRFKEIETLYQQALEIHKKKLLFFKAQEVHVPILKLLKTTPLHTVLYEIIKQYGFTASQTAEVAALLNSETGRYVQSSTHRAIRNRNWLVIAPVVIEHAAHFVIDKPIANIDFAAGKLKIKQFVSEGYKIDLNAHVASFDAATITFPLLLRKWKQGDYFYPLGMQKKKKLSRFLIDQKKSLIDKENTWVLEMNKKIIWVVGLRIDDRFKITSSTTQILQITLC